MTVVSLIFAWYQINYDWQQNKNAQQSHCVDSETVPLIFLSIVYFSPDSRQVVWCLAALGGRIFAGEMGGRVRVWDPATGACEGDLPGHHFAVLAVLAVGSRLVSGDGKGVVKVWSRSGEEAVVWGRD
jgi:WD40 repeat protein